MNFEQLPLSKQVEVVFQEIQDELYQLSSGMIIIHIRNNSIGKFGVRHNPLESKGGQFQACSAGLSEIQIRAFRQMAVEALRYKTSWSHGEICFEFTLKQATLCASVQFESNYNMSNFPIKSRNGRHELH